MNSYTTILQDVFVYQSILGLSMNGWILILIMISLSGAACFIFLGAKKTGQFNDVEGIKYRMLFYEEDDLDIYE